MHTKIVYILVSDANDTFLEQAWVSIYSLRKYHQESVVELVVDENTNFSLTGKREEMLKLVSHVTTINIPEEYHKIQRSRYLKTNLRKLVSGDYLFIDCDTIICGRLDEIDNTRSDIAMVADINGDLLLKDQQIIDRCEAAGFKNLKGKPYFNSGVIYAKDTPVAHRLYEEWHKQWQISDHNGISFDQPALSQANHILGSPIMELSGFWNCQYKYRSGYKLMDDSVILHYYSNNGIGKQSYAQNRIFEYIKEKGCITPVVDNIVSHPKTIFYTASTINSDKAFEYFYSDMLHTFLNVPKVYKIVVSVAKLLSKSVNFINKKK